MESMPDGPADPANRVPKGPRRIRRVFLRRRVSRGLSILAAGFGSACGDDSGDVAAPREVPNRSPVAIGEVAPQTVFLGDTVTVDVSTAFTDPDGDPLTFAASSLHPAVAGVSISGSDVSVAGRSRGTTTVSVSARDPAGAEARQHFGVEVPNRNPVTVGEVPPQSVFLGERVTVDVSAAFSDPDGDPLTFEASSSDPAVVGVTASGVNVTLEGAGRGTATVTVTARDPDGGEAGQGFEVTVPNRDPVTVGEVPPQWVFLGERVTVDVSAAFSDPDGDPLTFEASSSDPAVVGVTASGVNVTLEGAGRGTATVTVTARDPDGGEAGQGFEVTVPNRDPVTVGEVPPQSVFLGERVTVDVSAAFSDPDGDPLTFEASSSDPAVVGVTASGVNVTLEGAGRGTATVTVTARDPDGGEAGQGFEVTVPNRDPVTVGEVPPQSVFLGERVTVDVSAAFSDPDGDPLAFEASSSDPAVVGVTASGVNVTLEGAGRGTATVTVTATDNGGLSAHQSFEVSVRRPAPPPTVTATDNGGLSAHQSFEVSVRRPAPPPNQSPVVTGQIPSQSVGQNGSVSLDLGGYFRDPEGGPLHYGASSSDDGVATAETSGSDVIVRGVSEGTATVTVTATDNGGLSAGLEFGVTVESTPTNRAPVVTQTISDQTLGVGKSIGGPMDSYFSDPDNDPLIYAASSSNPAAVTAETAHIPLFPVVYKVEAVAEGTATVTLSASDPAGLSASFSFEITAEVLPNNPPVVTQSLPDQSVNVGQELTVTRSLHDYFRDPDNDRLGFSASSSNAAVLAAGYSPVSGLWISGLAAGTETVTVTATDEAGASVSQEFTATVVELPNQAPVVAAQIPDQSLRTGDPVTEIALGSYFSDPDDDPLTFRASSSNRGTVSVGITDGVLNLQAYRTGSVTITVTATDPGLKSVSQEFTATATEADASTDDGVSADGDNVQQGTFDRKLSPPRRLPRREGH